MRTGSSASCLVAVAAIAIGGLSLNTCANLRRRANQCCNDKG